MEQALIEHNLAPLNSRRDIAKLGLIHRTMIGSGPIHFQNCFTRAPMSTRPDGREAQKRHDKQIVSYRQGDFLQLVTHSILGLVDIYNLLPKYVVNAWTVKLFQHRLQELLKASVTDDVSNWKKIFSPRDPLFCHALRKWHGWEGTGKVPEWLR